MANLQVGMRNHVRGLLKKYDYPPELQEGSSTVSNETVEDSGYSCISSYNFKKMHI